MAVAPDVARPPAESTAVRARAILLALLIIPGNAWWVVMMEAVKYTGHPTTYSLYFNVVIILVALTAVNELLSRVWRAPFTRTDLLVVYFMVALATSLAGHDQAQVLMGVIMWPIFKATPENNWANTFGQFIPHWLVPRDPDALREFFVGNSSFWAHWQAFVVPLACWGAFTLALLLAFFCLNVILRRQWVESERLTFPLVALPLEMVEPELRFYRHRAMWIAFCIPLLINVVNNLHQWLPGLPEIKTRSLSVGQFITNRYWAPVAGTPMFIFPFAIGIGYLLPLDVLGSSWIFFWWWKMERVIGTALGLTTGHPNAPYISEQAYGGYIALAVLAAYAGRQHLRRVLRCAVGRDPEYARTCNEALPYAVAVWGFVLAFSFLIWFGRMMGMEWWPLLAVFGGYFGISIAVDRLRAEFGCPTHDLHAAYPGDMLPRMFGSLSFSPRTLTGFALFFWFNRAHRSHPMPVQLESLVACGRVGASQRRLALALGLAAVVGLVSAYIGVLQPHYARGADSARTWGLLKHFGNEAWQFGLATNLQTPRRAEPASLYAMLVGFVFCVGLFACRIRVAGFPLHPVGFAVSSSWSLDQVWLSLFIAWLCKVLVVRYGGLKLYRQAIPFALGLILGDFVVGGIFNMVGIFTGASVYHFLG